MAGVELGGGDKCGNGVKNNVPSKNVGTVGTLHSLEVGEEDIPTHGECRVKPSGNFRGGGEGFNIVELVNGGCQRECRLTFRAERVDEVVVHQRWHVGEGIGMCLAEEKCRGEDLLSVGVCGGKHHLFRHSAGELRQLHAAALNELAVREVLILRFRNLEVGVFYLGGVNGGGISAGGYGYCGTRC